MIGNVRLRETVGNLRLGVPVFLVAFNSLGPGKGKKGSETAEKESAGEESRAVDWRGDFFRIFPP